MKITIIGGGAAGLMAAAAIHETDPEAEVFLIERNDIPGKKVALSGGGRCNITTGLSDMKEILARYPRGGKFLSSAMRRFPPEATVAWFEAHGVPLKAEDDLRVFPRSDRGKDVVDAFEKLFHAPKSKVRVLVSHRATGIEKTPEGFIVKIEGRPEIRSDRLILTTGGQAYRATGSTGDGYAFAESLGHTITPLAPSLHSLFLRETWVKDLSGISFKQATLSTAVGKARWTGPFIFTHRGVSGPAVFALSAILAYEKPDQAHPLEVSIDLFPEESVDELAGRIAASCKKEGKKSLVTVLGFLVPKAISPIIVSVAGRDGGIQAAQATKTDFSACASAMKSLKVHAVGRGAGDEFVTAGGVKTEEIDQRTMESKVCPGLYLAGEILDVDGVTGGFNLQAAWATGRAAGESAAS